MIPARKCLLELLLYVVLPAGLLLGGCGQRDGTTRDYVIIKDHRFTVEIADTPGKARVGLMFRKDLPPDNGMMFIFDRPHVLTFWMKNTYIPLDVAFVSKDMTILNIATMPALTDRKFYSAGEALVAIEVPAGTFKRYRIEPGERITVGPKVLKLLAPISDK